MKPREKLFLGLGLAIVAVALGLLLVFPKADDTPRPSPKPFDASAILPAAADVESMTAEYVYYDPQQLPTHALPPADRPRGDQLPEFPVPQEQIAKILDTLQPARAVDFEKEGNAAWVTVGDLLLRCKDGRSVRVTVYLTPASEPGAFGVFGVAAGDKTWGKYRAGKTRQMWGALIEAYVGFRAQKDRSKSGK